MSIDEILSWFSQNPWVVFIGSVGLILVLILSIKEILTWIIDGRKKPKLIFHPSPVHEDIKKQEGIYYTRVNFWINVTNKGKKQAQNCHAYIKFTSENFRENLVWKSEVPQPSMEDPFGVHWHFLDTKKDVVDIPVTDRSSYMIKIPFYFELLQTKNPEWKIGDVMGWEPPVKELEFGKIDMPKQWDAYESALGIVLEISFNENERVKSNFLIRKPRNMKTERSENDPWSIEFFEVQQ